MAASKKKVLPGPAAKPKTAATTIGFDYIKSNFFRVVHADGIIGGKSPNGDIHLAVWSERMPLPRNVEYEVDPEGQLINEVSREARESFVREIDVDIVMKRELALQIVAWLTHYIRQEDVAEEDEAKEEETPE